MNLLLLSGLVTLAVVAMPASMAVFEGQHLFVKGNNVDCAKCHQDVYTELTQSDQHSTKACADCHSASMGADTTHAVATVECIACHSGEGTELDATTAAHNEYYQGAKGQTWLKGGSEACIGCHTKTAVNVTWIEPSGYSMDASIDPATGAWTLDNWQVN
ncbi:MAG: hypothetical protein V3R86_06910 [Candidatus Hydrothermarchaeaceae archaeon]